MIGDRSTRTLLALIELHGRHSYASVRDVSAACGQSLDTTGRHLHTLADEGLVDIGVHGGLRPLVRVVPFVVRGKR